ncbi:hypothetical protein Sru01_64870 [Sphaerisporangium rufum]|uniref:Putative gamma-glutamylcyclotransferase n=1 Tax=Sphaerisporangium rufum TaxID=1381558 RepID=A0A919RB60_9ACTN|nr:gamma-glutamylcyclotransferase family protein [Sphaerisporangium rufum]GII81505.1 hypothetical protein Sru01_64870 [Sphaerisporangium rufum]
MPTAEHRPDPPAFRTPDRLAARPRALFVYGSLLFPEVWHALLGWVPASTPAAVDGWRVAALPGQVYPVLVPAGAVARGRLVTGLTLPEWRVVDAFEDDFYELRRLTTRDGRPGWAYVADGTVEVRADDWDARHFGTRELAAFVARCGDWRPPG